MHRRIAESSIRDSRFGSNRPGAASWRQIVQGWTSVVRLSFIPKKRRAARGRVSAHSSTMLRRFLNGLIDSRVWIVHAAGAIEERPECMP